MAVKAGVIGTGFMGGVHTRAILAAGGEMVGVASQTLDLAQDFARTAAPRSRPVSSLPELLDLGIDVVHICTPNFTHYELAHEALAAGVSVICEKPLATSVADAVTLAQAARTAQVVTGVPFVYRYYPAVREIRSRILSNERNRLWLLHGSYLQDWLADPAVTNWRVDPAAGGSSRAFGDIGVHWCDLMEFVTGQRIVRLSARTGNAFVREGGGAQNSTEDGAVVAFETDAGALGSVAISQASAGRRNRLWFSFDGPHESYSFDQENPESAWVGGPDEIALVHRAPGRPSAQPARRSVLPAGHPQGYQQCFEDFVEDTYSAIAGTASPGRPSFDDGLRAAVLTQAVIDSARSEQWVDVPTEAETTHASTPAQVSGSGR